MKKEVSNINVGNRLKGKRAGTATIEDVPEPRS